MPAVSDGPVSEAFQFDELAVTVFSGEFATRAMELFTQSDCCGNFLRDS